MGVYALLAGPVVALVLRVFAALTTHGVITGTDSVPDTLLELYVSIGLFLLFPIVLFVVVYKVISWAGQPLGIGQAFSMTVAAVAAATGALTAGATALTGAATGGASAAVGGASTGGASGAAGAGSSVAGAVSDGGTAVDPSAATDGTSVGASPRNSIGDSVAQTHRERGIEELSPGDTDDIRTDGPESQIPPASPIGKAAVLGRKTKSKLQQGKLAAAQKLDLQERVGQSLATHRGAIDDQLEVASTHQDNAKWISQHSGDSSAAASGFDLVEATDRGLLDGYASPADGTRSVMPIVENGERHLRYPTDDGEYETVNLSQVERQENDKATAATEKATSHADAIRTVQAVGWGVNTSKQVGKATFSAAKIPALTMLGAATNNPYLGHRIGQRGMTRKPANTDGYLLISPTVTPAASTTDDELADEL